MVGRLISFWDAIFSGAIWDIYLLPLPTIFIPKISALTLLDLFLLVFLRIRGTHGMKITIKLTTTWEKIFWFTFSKQCSLTQIQDNLGVGVS